MHEKVVAYIELNTLETLYSEAVRRGEDGKFDCY